MIFYQSERRYPLPPSVFFCTPPLFNSSLCSWFEIVSFVRKCKNHASMVIISRDIRCFMLALFYLEMWWVIFNIKWDFLSEWEEVPPHPPLSVIFCTPPLFNFFWSWTKINCVFCQKMSLTCLSCNYLQSYKMFYVGTSLLRKFDGWYSI